MPSHSAILREQLQSRIVEGKREACEIMFNDFDDVAFKINSSPEAPNVVKVNMQVRCINELMSNGSSDLIKAKFPGCEVTPDPDYQVAIQFDCDNLPSNYASPEAFLAAVIDLKRHVLGGPLLAAFGRLEAHSSTASAPVVINYRMTTREIEYTDAAGKSVHSYGHKVPEYMFICSASGKVTVIFYVDFADATDRAMARVFLQEFVEAQRTVRTAAPVSFSREPPGEIAALKFDWRPDSAGFLSFSLEDRHVQGSKKDAVVSRLVGFRPYLHYHIKCSKTYLHMRMRKRVAGWLQVLNRAIPEQETEKKTSAGKTFVRK